MIGKQGEIVFEGRLMSKEGLRLELEMMNEDELVELRIAVMSYLVTTTRRLSFSAITSYTNDAKALLETINGIRMDKTSRSV